MRITGDLPLILRINVLLSRMEVELTRGQKALERFTSSGDPELQAFLAEGMIAKAVHHLYSGLEAIFEEIATDVDGGKPAGEHWHARLVSQMMAESAVRRAVIPSNLARDIADLRGFRHFFRSSYGVDMRSDEVIEKFLNLRDKVLPEMLASLEKLSVHLGAPPPSEDEDLSPN